MQGKQPDNGHRARRASPEWQEQPYEEPYAYEEPPYEEIPYEEPYAEEGYDEPVRATRMPPQPEVIATNTAIRLTCTLCAMCGLLAVFMCWAEKESRAIRYFAVQSTAVSVLHLLGVVMLLLISKLLGGIPFLGFLLTMVCWLLYIALLVVILVVRARMMLHAWRGIRFTLPGLWRMLEQFE